MQASQKRMLLDLLSIISEGLGYVQSSTGSAPSPILLDCVLALETIAKSVTLAFGQFSPALEEISYLEQLLDDIKARWQDPARSDIARRAMQQLHVISTALEDLPTKEN